MMSPAPWHSDPLARTFTQSRYLSQSSRRLASADKPRNAEPPKSSAHSSSEPGAGAQPKRQSTLDRMGATRTVKIVVIVFICIYGTMETIFYAGALYRYLNNKPEPE